MENFLCSPKILKQMLNVPSEVFNHDLNRLSWTEYEVRDEINQIRHIHSCKPVLGSGFPVDQGRANKYTSK